MATRKTVTTETVETAPGSDATKKDSEEIIVSGDVDNVEQDLIAELLAAGIEEEITYQVRRVAPADKAAYCTKYSRGDLSLDRIREDWGPGTYTITAFDAANKYRKRNTVKIAEGMKTTTAPPSLTGQLAEMAQILRANVPAAPPPTTDIAGVLTAIMSSQTQLLTAILNRPVPTPPPPPDPLAMIAALKDVLKPSKESSEVDILLKGLTLGKELGGGSEWTDVVAKGLDAVVPLLGNQNPTAPAPRPGMRPRPTPPARQLPKTAAPTGGTPATDTPAKDGEEGANVQIVQKLQWLTRQATVLCHQAAAQKDPALYAEVFLDNLPDYFTLDEVHEHLSKPDAVEQLGKLHAPVLQHREWFEKFRREALDMMEADDEDEDPPAGDVIEGESTPVRRTEEKAEPTGT